MKKYTIEQFKKFLKSQDSLGDIHYNLSEETMDEIAEEFRCKFGDRYDLHCTCKDCQNDPEKKVEQDKDKKTSDDFENDFCEYALVRLQGWGGREEFILEALVHHITHVFWTFDFTDTVLFFLIVDGFMADFKAETEGHYSMACACCTEKMENGELKDYDESNNCEGC